MGEGERGECGGGEGVSSPTPPTAPPTSPAPAFSGDSYRAWAKARFLNYFRSPQVARTYGVGVPWVSIVIAGVLCLTIVGIPAAIGILIGLWLRYSRADREYQAACRQAAAAEPIMTYPLMVNAMLRRVKNFTAPGLVIGTFQCDVSHDYFVDLAKLIFEINASTPKTEDERFVAQLFQDEEYQRDRRRLLPMGLTGGIEVYAFDLMISNANFPRQILESPLVPCMATPGQAGMIFMIPWTMTGDPRDWLIMMGVGADESEENVQASSEPDAGTTSPS